MPARQGTPTREAIGIARVLCILGIVYVHAWTGRIDTVLAGLAHTPQGILRWTLIEFVGRCAVPLLGAVSGWLVGPSANKRSYFAFTRVKARTILAPMLAWNVIAMALVCGFAKWGKLQAPIPANWHETLDWLTCFTQANPINVQISFLRDLFVCMLAAPLLARLPSWALAVAALLAATWSMSALDLTVLLRPQILVFFLIGLLARRHGWAEAIDRWPVWGAVTPYVLTLLPKTWLAVQDEAWLLAHPGYAGSLDLPLRIAAALAVWRVATWLARRRFGGFVLRGERYAFLLFCSHLALLWLLGPVVGLYLTGPLAATPWYALFFLLQPFLSLGFAIGLGRLLEWTIPPVANLLSGGRLAQPPSPALPPRVASVMEPANPIAGAPRP